MKTELKQRSLKENSQKCLLPDGKNLDSGGE